MENGFKAFIEKYYTAILVVLTVLFVISLVGNSTGLFSGMPNEFSLLPLERNQTDSLYEAATYSDITELNGASSITPLDHSSNSMKYSYTINSGYEYPYAGLSLYANKLQNKKIQNFINISKYSDIYLDITAENSTIEQIYIKPVIPEFTKLGKKNKGTRGYLRYDIPLTDGHFEGTIALSEFFTPDWWYSNNKVNKNELAPADFSQVIEIVFQNSEAAPIGKEINVEIKKISFVRDTKKASLTITLVFLLLLIVISSIKFIKVPVAKVEDDDDSEKIVISYDRVEIEDEQNNDLQRITDFIASNYSNPDFSVEQLAKGAGVSTSRIPTLLKKQYSMNFKQYLNTVRITEAKRLLLETDHQIVTIAHSVGYNNIPHFNRTFKQVTGLSPKKYRENPDEAIDNLPGTASNKE